MILPTIASVSRDVLLAVPNTLREGALALGATRWEMVRKAVLPCAKNGILGAVILGLGRALGETMAVTMVIGNRARHLLVALRAGPQPGQRHRQRTMPRPPGISTSAR